MYDEHSPEACPCCGTLKEGKCEWPDCYNVAVWEAWVLRGIMNCRMHLCEVHVKESRGWKTWAKERPPEGSPKRGEEG